MHALSVGFFVVASAYVCRLPVFFWHGVCSGSGGRNSKEITRAAFEAASARVSFISDALRRMDELLQKQQSHSENGGSPGKTGQTGAASRKRK